MVNGFWVTFFNGTPIAFSRFEIYFSARRFQKEFFLRVLFGRYIASFSFTVRRSNLRSVSYFLFEFLGNFPTHLGIHSDSPYDPLVTTLVFVLTLTRMSGVDDLLSLSLKGNPDTVCCIALFSDNSSLVT